MALIGRLFAALEVFLFFRVALCQTETTSVTTLAGALCATPSCVVTPEAITSLTFQPASTTVDVPGREEPLTFTFDSITVSSFQPDPTTMANDGSATLTLGSTTITDFPSASATQSYTVETETTVTLTAAVTVKVQAEAQLFIAEESDPNAFCELFPGGTTRRGLFKHGIAGRRVYDSIIKRNAQILKTNDATAKAFINTAITEAETVITAILTYFEGVTAEAVDLAPEIGLFTSTRADEKSWLPQTFPAAAGVGVTGSMYQAFINMLTSMKDFLTDPTLEFVVTSLDTDLPTQMAKCARPNLAAITYPDQLSGACPAQGYIVMCPFAWTVPGQGANSAGLNSADADLITDTECQNAQFRGNVANLLNTQRFPFPAGPGSRAATLYHEMTHLPEVCERAGWGMVSNTRENPAEPMQATILYSFDLRDYYGWLGLANDGRAYCSSG